MIIAVCGCDASGKATQTKLLAKKLNATRFEFPSYATPAGQAILGNLKGEWAASRLVRDVYGQPDSKLNALVLQSLMTINRFEMLPQILEAAEHGHVIFDRYYVSALVYGGLDGLDRAWIERIQAPLPEPDLWILLDVPVEEGFRRRPERRDRYEQDREYLERVRGAYQQIFEERAHLVNWVVVDGVGTVEEIHARIMWQIAMTVKARPEIKLEGQWLSDAEMYAIYRLCDGSSIEDSLSKEDADRLIEKLRKGR